MNKSSIITLRVPHALKHRVIALADEQGVSMNQFAMYALTDIVNQMEINPIMARLAGQERKDVIVRGLAVLDEVQEQPVPEWDEIITA